MIDSFSGEFQWASNFFIEPDGTHVEGEFQAAKTDNLTDKARILLAPTPGKAKRLGRKVTLTSTWESDKFRVMRDLVFRKFFDHMDLAEKLKGTHETLIVEGNNWHDNVWGNCSCDECCDIQGQNWLGIILMDIRKAMREGV